MHGDLHRGKIKERGREDEIKWVFSTSTSDMPVKK